MNKTNAKFIAARIRYTFYFLLLPFAFLLLSACASFRAASDVQAGRYALLNGKPEVAQSHFQRAAETSPDFVYRFSPLQQSVWTYMGRAYYDAGRLPDARQALERAVSKEEEDYLARLYLGLTMSRNGNRNAGLKEIEAGLKGVHDWLEHIESYTLYGEFWDPDRKIRSEIQTNLAMISGRDIDWQTLIDRGEWVGMQMEEEIDVARRDERLERHIDGEGDEP
jgi:tetratricopeptide (TPR) repeat protein